MKPAFLLVGNFLSAKGGSRSVGEELAERLAGMGYPLVTTSRVHSRVLRLADMLWTTFSRRRSYQVAYLEVFSGAAFLWAEMVCQLLSFLRKPYLLSLHGGNLPAFARRWPGRVRRLFQSASKVIAPSRYLQEEMRSYWQDILLLPNPLEIKNYPFRLRTNPKPRLVWLRAFHNIYHPQMAPRIIAALCESFPEITFTMIGPDKGDGALQETQTKIEKLGLQTKIQIMLGIPKYQVPERLSQFDIFINTTTMDNTPVSVLEAMACGLCIVSTNVGGLPYLLEDGVDALLVPSNDPEAMALAVLRVLTEPGLAARLSQNARHKADTFDWANVLPLWEKLFLEVASD